MLNALRAFALAGISVVLFLHAVTSLTIFLAVFNDDEVRADDPTFWYVVMAYLNISLLAVGAIFVYIALGGGR